MEDSLLALVPGRCAAAAGANGVGQICYGPGASSRHLSSPPPPQGTLPVGRAVWIAAGRVPVVQLKASCYQGRGLCPHRCTVSLRVGCAQWVPGGVAFVFACRGYLYLNAKTCNIVCGCTTVVHVPKNEVIKIEHNDAIVIHHLSTLPVHNSHPHHKSAYFIS